MDTKAADHPQRLLPTTEHEASKMAYTGLKRAGGSYPPSCVRPRQKRHFLYSILLFFLGAMGLASLVSRTFSSSLSSIFFEAGAQRIIQLKKLPSNLVPAKTNDRRIIVVGDVHGCKAELEHLLSHINFDKMTDHLVLAGDMIDKGPSSHGVIKLARELGASCVRGNHEDNILKLRDQQDRGVAILGGESSSKRLRASILASELSDKDIEWLRECPLILEIGKLSSMPHASSVVVAHAGLVPGVSLLAQDPFAVMHMRSISKRHSRFEPNEGRDEGEPWYKVWNHEQELLRSKHAGTPIVVVYGHDSRTGLNEKKWSLGLDSGCVNGGRMSAVVVDNRHAKVHSVKCMNERDD